MSFRKINYLTLIYHFFIFNYTIGSYNKINNENFYRKSKMKIFFPSFTSLNNLEGRPVHLKKRPYALYYFSLFCKGNKRETFLPLHFSTKTRLLLTFFRYASCNNFLMKRRTQSFFQVYTYFEQNKIFFNDLSLTNVYNIEYQLSIFLFFKLYNCFFTKKYISKIMVLFPNLLCNFNLKYLIFKDKKIINFRKKNLFKKLPQRKDKRKFSKKFLFLQSNSIKYLKYISNKK